MTTKFLGYRAGPDGAEFRTGNETHHAPAGWRVFIDTSWDGRGTTVAAREGDIERISRGSPESLGRVRVNPDALYLRDGQVDELLALAHGELARVNGGLGLSDQGSPAVDAVIVTP